MCGIYRPSREPRRHFTERVAHEAAPWAAAWAITLGGGGIGHLGEDVVVTEDPGVEIRLQAPGTIAFPDVERVVTVSTAEAVATGGTQTTLGPAVESDHALPIRPRGGRPA